MPPAIFVNEQFENCEGTIVPENGPVRKPPTDGGKIPSVPLNVMFW